MESFATLPNLVLGPLAGRSASDWHHAPPGKWSPAQIIEHLAISLDYSGAKFLERRAKDSMIRRPRTLFQRVAYLSIMRIGWIPRLFNAPEGTRPSDHPDPEDVERRFRAAHARFQELEPVLLPARGNDLFVKHPAMGDLNFAEWLHFHCWHATHHTKQIHERLPR